MTIVEELKNNKNLKGMAIWEEMTNHCRETQERMLTEILDFAKDSEFGRKNNLAGIKSVEEFQKALPVSQWSDIEDLSERMAVGEENLLFPGRPEVFISTSGTTGKSKMLPETKMSIAAKNNVVILRAMYLFYAASKAPNFGKWLAYHGIKKEEVSIEKIIKNVSFYSITAAPVSQKTPAGIELVYASGSTVANSGLGHAASYPAELTAFEDSDAVTYLSMLFSMKKRDLLAVLGNNATSFKVRIDYVREHAQMLVDDMRNGTISQSLNLRPEERKLAEELFSADPERADELQAILDTGAENFIPKNYWPYLTVCCFWLSGSVGMNIRELVPLLSEGVMFMDGGYGASEAKINIPYIPGAKDGTLATCSAFYEFLDEETGKIYCADEVEVGKEYNLIVTTYGGLYRYDMHDVVRVNSMKGNTPNIEFVSKAGEILNVAQEKLPASVLAGFMKDYFAEKGMTLKQMQVFQNLENKCYDIYFENETEFVGDLDEIRNGLDKYVMDRFELFGYTRRFNYMNQLTLTEMKEGWQDSLFAAKVASGIPVSQVKLNMLIKEQPDSKWFK